MRAVMFRTTGAACSSSARRRPARRRARAPQRLRGQGRVPARLRRARAARLGALQVAFEQLKRRLQAEGLFDAGAQAAAAGAAAAHRRRHVARRRGGARHPAHPHARGIRRARVVDPAGARAGRGRGGRSRARARGDRAACRTWTSSSSAAAADRPKISGPSTTRRWRARSRPVRCRSFPPSATRSTSRSPTSSPTCARRRRRTPPSSSSIAPTTSARASIARSSGCARAMRRARRAAAPAAPTAPTRGCATGRSSVVLRDRDRAGAGAAARRTRSPAGWRARAQRFDGAAPAARAARRASRRRRPAHAARRAPTAGCASCDRRATASRPTSRARELAARLDALSPLAVLGRGYAVCWNEARTSIIRSAGAGAPGDRVRVTLAEGELACRVERATSTRSMTDVHQGLRIGDRRAREDRQAARRRRPGARQVARALRARRRAVALLPRPARRGAASHRAAHRARRAEGRVAPRRRRRRPVAAVPAARSDVTTYLAELRADRRRRRCRARSPTRDRARRSSLEAMRYALLGGGKRLRPCLTLAVADAVGDARGLADRPTRARSRCPPPARSRWSTPTRSCTTTCRRWTTTRCGAAGRRRTSSTATAWRFSPATGC